MKVYVLMLLLCLSLLFIPTYSEAQTAVASDNTSSSNNKENATNSVLQQNESAAPNSNNDENVPNSVLGQNKSTTNTKIAIVQPTFTEAAYYKAFYVFYDKYSNVTSGVNIASDLNLLTAHLNDSKVFCCKVKNDIAIVGDQIKDALPNATVTNLTDQDIEEGKIFSDQKNAFDV